MCDRSMNVEYICLPHLFIFVEKCMYRMYIRKALYHPFFPTTGSVVIFIYAETERSIQSGPTFFSYLKGLFHQFKMGKK
jgi:hypothetical protein